MAISVLLVILVLLQPRGSGLGSAFGGGGGSFFATRRGIQEKLYWVTVILGIAFVVLAILNLLL